jgi:myo-inositol-1(or 4)-monophosphatase
MNRKDIQTALEVSIWAATKVGADLRRHLHLAKTANEVTQHDIKLELDVASQKRIEAVLTTAFPSIGVLGEEGIHGDTRSGYRWVVDPIDGTVNFTYGIPHACVSIALQGRAELSRHPGSVYEDGYETLLGVVYDPFCNELWTAVKGGPARLNRMAIRVSDRSLLREAVVSIGFAKTRKNLEATLPYFNQLVHQVRKIRIMGAAALALTYVATGRFDGYIERGIRLWDIAAGGLILECAGGSFRREAVDPDQTYRMVASNMAMRKKLKMPPH